jgi:hypothetical protein
MDSAPIVIGDEMCVYYTEANCAHPVLPLSRFITRIRMATWRVDGFTSMKADGCAGELLTHPIQTSGKRLIVNFKPSRGGSLRVAMLGADGGEIRGYHLADCDPLQSDQIAAPVSWRGGCEIPRRDGPIRLRFAVDGGELFGFRFSGPRTCSQL